MTKLMLLLLLFISVIIMIFTCRQSQVRGGKSRSHWWMGWMRRRRRWADFTTWRSRSRKSVTCLTWLTEVRCNPMSFCTPSPIILSPQRPRLWTRTSTKSPLTTSSTIGYLFFFNCKITFYLNINYE